VDSTAPVAAAWHAWWPWARPVRAGAASATNLTGWRAAPAVSTHTQR
jgi:hypothetical protein